MPVLALTAAFLANLAAGDLKPEGALDRYIQAHPLVRAARGSGGLALTSQRWQGKEWHHDVTEATPSKLRHRGIAVLAITGGTQNSKDKAWAKRIADKAGLPVFSLFDVPNQPIWDKWEDDLVAHTFAEYLRTGDENWPLLFPMANSAVRAMDAIQKDSAKLPNPIKRFVITGESKRGWTTWLLGTVQDKRIVGIAPFIYDNLNIPAQLAHQQKLWGHYSPMYEAYKDQGLLDILNTEPGKRLVAMVDPYARIGRLKVPVLNVIGSSDPFWAVDATGLYWGKIKSPKAIVVMPNKGHDFPGDKNSENALAAFARSCAGEFRMPTTLFVGSAELKGARHKWLWTAVSKSADFSKSVWTRAPLKGDGVIYRWGEDQLVSTVEAEFDSLGLRFSLFTPPKISIYWE
ncbi:MAG: hypothetical protein HZC36_08370 [Armatimonadetes bacterium]|nr:hypothetical protein [Armatimonadota bacterium]